VSVTFYSPAPIPPNEHARNLAVRASGLLERAEEPALTALAKAARKALGGDWAGVAVIVDDLQIVIASSGGQLGRYERARSMSAHAIVAPDKIFCVTDTIANGLFRSNPFVRVGLIRFFVAAPIVDLDGHALGVLCVSSRNPRAPLSEAEADTLKALAAQVLDRPPEAP
jgi:GAF domain-containing protein